MEPPQHHIPEMPDHPEEGLYVREHPQGPLQVIRIGRAYYNGETYTVVEHEAWAPLPVIDIAHLGPLKRVRCDVDEGRSD